MKSLKQLMNITTPRDRTMALLTSAIKTRHEVEFMYHGGYRTVEPFCLGLVHPGPRTNESLLCYQIGGYSELLDPIGWKLYRASEIEDVAVGNPEFVGDRPGYDPDQIPMHLVYAKVIPLRLAPGAPAGSIDELIHGTPAQAPVYLTHNSLMGIFRRIHPEPIPDLATLEPAPDLAAALPENAEPVPLPVIPVLEPIGEDDAAEKSAC